MCAGLLHLLRAGDLLRVLLLTASRASCPGLCRGLLACSATPDSTRRGTDGRSRAGVAGDRANRCTPHRSPGRAADGSAFRRRIGLRLRRPRRGIGIRMQGRGVDLGLVFGPGPALLLIRELLVLGLVLAREDVETQLARR